MNLLDYIMVITSIGSLIVAIISLFKVDKVEKHLINDDSNEVNQEIKNNQISKSNVKQVGRDKSGE